MTPNRLEGLVPPTGRDSLEIDRRRALQVLAAGIALPLAACAAPAEEIVPYVDRPERVTPGVPLYFATALALGGYARGALVKSCEGRPIKIDGNPRHPASRGGSDIFLEAAILSLYDPDRSKAVHEAGQLSSWTAFETALLAQMAREKARHGSGLRIVTGRLTSPTLIRQIDALLKAYPEARWHRYEPIDDDAVRRGSMLAFGRSLVPLPRLAETRVLLSLDADPLGPGPDQIRLANDFAQRRRAAQPAEFLRLYAVDSAWRLTGANADERVCLPPQQIANVAIAIANRLGANLPPGDLPAAAQRLAKAAGDDLTANRGHALVLAGEGQPPEVHALCHWINAQIEAPLDFIAPVDPAEEDHAAALHALAGDLAAGRVETFFALDCNPAYATPGELALGDSIARVPFSVHLGPHADETAARCRWHLPLSHALESWSDLRAFDGTASIVQPLIDPLYDTRTLHQVIGLIAGDLAISPHDAVRRTWQDVTPGDDFETSWRRWLQAGVVDNSAAPRIAAPQARLPAIAPAEPTQGLILTFAPDPSIWDGRFADNAWLQECAKPVSKEVWGNALHVSPAEAASYGLHDGDVVRLAQGGRTVETPVFIAEGQAQGVVVATLGYGRSRAGAIGNGVGFDAYRLRKLAAPWHLDDVRLEKTGRSQPLRRTQHHFKLDAEEDDILRTLTLQDLQAGKTQSTPESAAQPSLLPTPEFSAYKWAMVIDASLCIGCNACVVACQSENNVPVVGPEEIDMGRDMHWLRVDAYLMPEGTRLRGFQPVPCMQCEEAPCEPVCPVAASVHDSEGLNDQVYNRCIGTRFCQSNCPYKVRRFNFFGYSGEEAYANLGADVVKALYNPDVTVRARGVMEKCTYCVQRISHARHAAENDDRRIRDGEVTPACAAACPTRAISFGDVNTAGANINKQRAAPHHYAMLGHLGTRPSTTYLARLRNPSPAMESGE